MGLNTPCTPMKMSSCCGIFITCCITTIQKISPLHCRRQTQLKYEMQLKSSHGSAVLCQDVAVSSVYINLVIHGCLTAFLAELHIVTHNSYKFIYLTNQNIIKTADLFTFNSHYTCLMPRSGRCKWSILLQVVLSSI